MYIKKGVRFMQNHLFISVLNITCLLWTVISLSGFILYKYRTGITSWEEGIKKAITFGLDWICEEATGQASSDKLINPSLLLTNNEALELTQRFDGHPYDTPVLVNYTPNLNGISWYEIQAINLISKYASLDNSGIAKIAEHIIQTYFMQSRNTQIAIYIRVATPKRLYFAIPLSVQGNSFLAKASTDIQQNLSTLNSCNHIPANPDVPNSCGSLEEEINIFED